MKQNLTKFTWNKPLYCLCSNKSKIWTCYCYKLWIAWLCCVSLVILYNELVMLSYPSFPFILFFSQVIWSKLGTLFKLFAKRTNHFWTTPSTLFLSPVSLSSCSLRFFLSLQIFPLLFSHFLSFHFFWYIVFFEYLLWFYVYFLQISLSCLQEVAYF